MTIPSKRPPRQYTFIRVYFRVGFALQSLCKMADACRVASRAQFMIEYESNALTLAWFTTQGPAMARSNEQGGMFVWSRDDWRTGTKQFTSCSLAMVRHYMYNQPVDKRNLYEIIRECTPDGAPVPTKIYMDCDIDREACSEFMEKGRVFHAIMETDLREFLVARVDAVFGDASATPLMCMDSSTEKKFSMHYVMSGAMFTNNFHVGTLMRAFREYVAEKYGEPDQGHKNPYFYENTKRRFVVDGRMNSFVIDMIYTRNRAFRMLGNCKHGKGVLLLPLGLNRAQQATYVFGLGDFRRALVQDPVQAVTGPIFSVREPDGSEPQSRGCSRTLRTIDGVVPRGAIGWRTDIATEARREARLPGRQESLRVSREHGNAICTALGLIQSRTGLAAYSVKYNPYEMVFIVPCEKASMYCYIAARYHTTSACYYVIAYSRGEYHARCHKTGCKNEKKTWPILPRLREALDRFLASRECTTRPLVEVGGLATLLRNIEAQIPADYVARSEGDSAYGLFEDARAFATGTAKQNSQDYY